MPVKACPTGTPGSPTATPTLALLPIGYADGVFRTLSGRLDVLINGRRRRSVGRICMDQFVVDLGPGQVDVAEGDEAILFGPGTRGEPTAQDWADLLGTIHYEVVTSPAGTHHQNLPRGRKSLSDNNLNGYSCGPGGAGQVAGRCRWPERGRHASPGHNRAVR